MEFEFELTEADLAGTHGNNFIDSRSQRNKVSFLEFLTTLPFSLFHPIV